MLEYGARGPNEWDPYSEVWETRPELVLSLVDRMRVTGDDQSPVARNEAVAADRDAATEEVLASLGDDEETKGLVLAAQGSAQRFLAWRERTKTNCVKAIHEQRMAMRELGRRGVERGALDDQRLVFMLLDEELDDYIAVPASFAERLGERRAAWKELWSLEPPYFVEGDKGVPPLSEPGPQGDAEITSRPCRATCWRAHRAVPAWPGAPRGSCSTPAIRWRSSPATSSSRRTRIRPGRRCSSPPPA